MDGDATDTAQLELTYESPDGEEGYPGTLLTKAIYSLTDENGLEIELRAVTDKPTVINLANHSYFNLTGDGTKSILDHQLQINADRFTPTDAQSIPTGDLAPVTGTPFDFRALTPIGSRIAEKDQQLIYGFGYDHNWVLNQKHPGELFLAATVVDPASGRQLEVITTEPGLQFIPATCSTAPSPAKVGSVITNMRVFAWKLSTFRIHPINRPFLRPS